MVTGVQTCALPIYFGLTIILMALVLAVLFVGDNPRLMRRNRNQVVTLDRAISDEAELAGRLGELLNAKVLNLDVQRLDLVNDTTVVDVRFRVPRKTPAELETEPAEVSTPTYTSQASDDVAPALEPAGAPAAPTAQAWAGTRLSTVRTNTHAGQAHTQPVTITPAAQYVTRSATQQNVATR